MEHSSVYVAAGVAAASAAAALYLVHKYDRLQLQVVALRDEVEELRRLTLNPPTPKHNEPASYGATPVGKKAEESDSDTDLYEDASAVLASPFQEIDYSELERLLSSVDPSDHVYANNLVSEQLKFYRQPEEAPTNLLLYKGRAIFEIGERLTNADQRKQHRLESRYWLKLAMTSNRTGETVKWYSIAFGASIEYHSLTEQAAMSVEFKSLVDEAIDKLPDDGWCYFLLGRYQFSIYSLSWYQKKIVQTVFRSMPDFSVDQCLGSFQTAHRLISDEHLKKEVYYFLARCYLDSSDYVNSKNYFDRALAVKPLSADDRKTDEETLKILQQYRSYWPAS